MKKGQKKNYMILAINPGSTSTKIGVFKDEIPVFEYNVAHSSKMLEQFTKVWDQYNFRKEEIIETLRDNNIEIEKLDAVVGRGGLIKPIPSGVYYIDEAMIEDARNGFSGNHASNLGCVIAYSIGWEFSIPTFIVDPPTVDDIEPLAKVSGYKGIERRSIFHALNIFETSRIYAKKCGKNFKDINLIVAHMGGGITVAALRNGKAINVNNGLDEGPFTPERSGKLPLMQFMKYCISGDYAEDELKKMVAGKGGLISYFNTNKAKEVEDMVKAGSEKFRLIYEAMAYQIAEEIGARATNLGGRVDAIILTGGIAYSDVLCDWIKERVGFIAEVHRFPGELELEALASGGLRVLRGEESIKHYTVNTRKVGIYYWDSLDIYITAINAIEDKLKENSYKFRQKDSNLDIEYVNCNSSEEKARTGIERFVEDEVDLIFAIGSPASIRALQYLKGKSIPLICTGIYSEKVIGNQLYKECYASCYAAPINEQLEKTLLRLNPDIRKLGFACRIGELQSDIQHDELKEFCLDHNIRLECYDVQGQEDFEHAAEFFRAKKIEWLYLGADTITATSSRKELEVLTSEFPSICTLGGTVQNGGLIAYHSSWRQVANNAADLALDLFNDIEILNKIVLPPNKQLVVNRNTAEHFGLLSNIEKIKNVRFL